MALIKGFYLIFVIFVSFANSKKLPSWLTLCNQDDPQIEKCFYKVAEQIRPHLVKGIPDLFVPPFNPLILPQASLDNGDSFRASFKNIEIYYAEEFKFRNLKVDLPKLHIEMDILFPRLRIKSTYSIKGRILVLTLDGSGPADGNFTDVSARLVADGKLFEKNGKKYIDFGQNSIDLNLGKPHFEFADIFRENRELNDQTNKIINENILDIVDELKPVLHDTITQFIFGILKNLFDYYSFDELFPKKQ